MNDSSFEKLTLETGDHGLRVLTLADPRKRNAIGPQMHGELLEVGRALRGDDAARVLVVTGEGTAFCAGADLSALLDVEGASPATMRMRVLSYYESFLWIRELPFPTIAAVNGPAVGAGLNLALACDIVIGGPNAKFGATFSQIGLHPGGGCTYMLTRRMGPPRALATLLLGRTLDAEEALDTGIAESITDEPLAAARSMAATIAGLEPTLARDIKHAVRLAASEGFDATLTFEAWAQAATVFNPGVIEGIRAAGRTTRT